MVQQFLLRSGVFKVSNMQLKGPILMGKIGVLVKPSSSLILGPSEEAPLESECPWVILTLLIALRSSIIFKDLGRSLMGIELNKSKADWHV